MKQVLSIALGVWLGVMAAVATVHFVMPASATYSR